MDATYLKKRGASAIPYHRRRPATTGYDVAERILNSKANDTPWHDCARIRLPFVIPDVLQVHPIYMRPPRLDTAQLSLVRTPFDDPDFLFELKHDGFRALAHIWDGNCELVSRRWNAYKGFQDLRDNLGKLKVKDATP